MKEQKRFRRMSGNTVKSGCQAERKEYMNMDGRKRWYIPDGWIPESNRCDDSVLEGHEAVSILNCNDEFADVRIDIYFEDKSPVRDIRIIVPACRVKCIRMDHPEEINGTDLGRLQQYALRIVSNVNIIVQFGRMDISQSNLSYIGTMAYSE